MRMLQPKRLQCGVSVLADRQHEQKMMGCTRKRNEAALVAVFIILQMPIFAMLGTNGVC